MKAKFILAGILVLGIIFFEYGFIENLPEKMYEAGYTDITKIPPTSALPQYLGSLFLGAFRAVAIDVLWIDYEQEKEARRYYEAREVIELISYLQPRNEVVWDFLAWDVAYNLSLGERYFTLEHWWKWVKYGLLKLYDGSTHIKKSPYMKYDIGYMLSQKSYNPIYNGAFSMEFIEKVEGDDGLQGILSEGQKGTKFSPFELAIRWLEKARDDLDDYERETKSRYYVVPGGLVISKATTDAFIRDALYYQSILCWQRNDYAGAYKWLDKAIAHAQKIVDDNSMGGMGFSEKFVKEYKQLRIALPAVEKAFPAGAREDKIKALSLLEQFLKENGNFDEGFVCRMASGYKKSLGGDEFEYNDIPDYPTRIMIGKKISATISPTPQDVDFYLISVEKPSQLKIIISAPPELGLDVSVLDSAKKDAPTSKQVNGNEITITLSAKGDEPYYIKIFTPEGGKWSESAKYELEVAENK